MIKFLLVPMGSVLQDLRMLQKISDNNSEGRKGQTKTQITVNYIFFALSLTCYYLTFESGVRSPICLSKINVVFIQV